MYKRQPKKVVDLADRMRQILDRSMNEANALGMTRKVRGKRIPIGGSGKAFPQVPNAKGTAFLNEAKVCLLYTSDAADALLCVDLGGRRIIKKKNVYTL